MGMLVMGADYYVMYMLMVPQCFFLLLSIYICLGGLYYGSYSYPRELFLWCSGVVLYGLMMATGFIGYVLPWGQMSFWGATVIPNLFSAIPIVGNRNCVLVMGWFFCR